MALPDPTNNQLPLRPISGRFLTLSYIFALLLIAGLSIGTHILLEISLKGNEGSASIINKAGRQRMLSQRIAGLAAQYRLGDLSVRDDLRSAVDAFIAANEFLSSASRNEDSRDPDARKLQDVYFGPNSLDAQARVFAADARKIIELSPDDPALTPLLSDIFAKTKEPLLASLNDVVTIEQHRSEQRLLRLESLQWAILAIILVTLAGEAVLIFSPMIRRIIAYTGHLLHLATTDPLTGAANRRNFMEQCTAELDRARRYGRDASVLMIDVDHFKSINDTFGHAAGDTVLVAVATTLRETLRHIDLCGRLGGEEFAVLLPETPLPAAAVIAERIRERFAELTVEHGDQRIKFTVSIGCTSLTEDRNTLDDILRVADLLMYRAKETGRNRVISALTA